MKRNQYAQVLKFAVSSPGDPSVGIPSGYEEVTLTLEHGGHSKEFLEMLIKDVSESLREGMFDCGSKVKGWVVE